MELTSFVGRGASIAQLALTLERARLVTLTGPGGVGKTRLALQVADACASRFADGVRIVDLGLVHESSGVTPAVASALLSGVHAEAVDVFEFVRDRSLLLVLDTCEHLLPACKRVVVSLLQASPGSRILATSRAPLGLSGEHRWRVSPLSLPRERASLADVANTESVKLLVARVAAQQPDFQLTQGNADAVAALCRQLDGLPLGVELASAWVPLLGLWSAADVFAAPHAHLSPPTSRTARHSTLADSMAWSVALLSGADRLLLARLAVFAGGWTLEAAEMVCADERLPRFSILEGLEHLALQSLVQVEPAGLHVRYHLLETMRAYAMGRLVSSDELEPTRRRHLLWCQRLVETPNPWSVNTAHVDRLESELGNLRAALALAGSDMDREPALRLYLACWPLWLQRAPTEGQEWLAELWHDRESVTSRDVRMGGGWLAGMFAYHAGDTLVALRELDDAVRLADEAGNDLVRAGGRYYLGELYLERGEALRSLPLFEEAWRIARQYDHRLACGIQARLALVLLETGDLDAARDSARLALEQAEFSGHHWSLSRAWEAVASIAMTDGAVDDAVAGFERAAKCARLAHTALGRIEPAVSLAEARLSQRESKLAGGVLLDVIDEITRGGGLPRSILVRVLQAAAETVAQERPEQAARLAAAADTLRHGVLQLPSQRSRLERWEPRTRRRLGRRWAIAWASGRGLAPSAALAEARLSLSAVTTSAGAPGDRSALTPREKEVARLLAHDLTNAAIAQILGLSEGTVRVHVGHVLQKLGIHSRAQVVSLQAQWAPTVDA